MAEILSEVVVSPFLGLLYGNLSSLIQKEVGLFWGVDEEMRKLFSILSTIQDVLEDAEEKQHTQKSIKNWLRKLKDAAYDADDVLDEWLTEADHLKRRCSIQVFDSLLSCFQFEHVKFRWNLAKKMNKLRERFDEIAAERVKFHLREGVVDQRAEPYYNRETSSMLTETLVYGRDEEKESIVGLLLNSSDREQDLSIYTILGIGGLGKTTIAQLVYNDDRVKDHFEVRIWVCVSDDFDIKRLTKAVLGSISGSACDIEELDPLQRRLQQNLAGKRFLLVLDDVWNENQEEWSKFQLSLSGGAKGSSIIVTTRLETVASITSVFPPYRLKFLTEDDCWSLFKHRAFGVGNQERPELVQIGREIVKKCGGVPLAAKALGGLMRFKGEEIEWLSVRDSRIWDLPQSKGNNILPALRLSYTYLPSYSRQCFSFCSVYPKDYRMKKEEIIQLWIANGLVRSNERMQQEDIGAEIFNALLWRSFFQDVEKDEDGDIVWCKMHDLVHDLACSLMENEYSFMEVKELERVPRLTRHLSMIFKGELSSFKVVPIYESSPSLRTLMLLAYTDMDRNLKFSFSKFTSLRAMSLEFSSITDIPDSIRNLKHLRYLNLSGTIIMSLPESICSLRNLRTLNLAFCGKLLRLPKSIGEMGSLRHLNIRECYQLTQMPTKIGQLTLLQTLSIYIVGSNNGCHIKELQGLNQLKGELTIAGLQCVKDLVEAKQANLTRKQYLSSLILVWSPSVLQGEMDTNVIEGFQPHMNLKKLSINCYQGQTFPSWMDVSYLPNLVEVSLSTCRRWEHLPAFGKFPFLKKLFVRGMTSLIFIEHEVVLGGFRSLEQLELSSLPKLKEWSSLKENGGELPCLKKLSIKNCPELMRFTLSLSLECLELDGCNKMVLRGVKDLPYLTSLTVYGLDEHISFPEEMLENLTALQSLHIQFWSKLRSLPLELENLTTLTNLHVWECNDLLCLPEGLRKLSSLKSIEIAFYPDLKCFPEVTSSLVKLNILSCTSLTTLSGWLRYQTCLQDLHISGCPQLEISKVAFQHLISLRNLTLWGFPELRSLPEGILHVTSLRRLEVVFCENLRILPNWLQNLTSLQCLNYEGCHPDLHKLCRKDSGEDWHKIAHVPKLLWDGPPCTRIPFSHLGNDE